MTDNETLAKGRLLSTIVSKPTVLPGQHHRSGGNQTFVIGKGSGWLFEIREPAQQGAKFSIKRDVSGGDPVEVQNVGHNETRRYVHIGPESEKNNHYPADPSGATADFTIDIYESL